MSNTSDGHLEITDLAAFLEAADAVDSGRADVVRAGMRPPLAMAMADLDRFGEINDRLGMAAGDRVLAAFERTLSGSLPPDTVIARLGGDEYAVAFPGTSAESALIQLEEVRAHYAAHGAEGVDEALDASFGIAARPPHAEDTAEVLRCAAEALARAKREGAGRSVIYVEEKMTMKSNYYSRGSLRSLAKLAATTSRTEASLLREALDDLFVKHRDKL